MTNEIIVFNDQDIQLNVELKEETVWLTQAQMASLFDKDKNTINDHIRNIFKEGELEEETSTGISGQSSGGRHPKLYNLDVIISVGYRVKSKNGIIFRRWANKVLKDYLIKGYAINQRRLEALEKTVKVLNVATRVNNQLGSNDESREILKVLENYTKALDLINDYDHKKLPEIKGRKSNKKIEYEECVKIIRTMKYSETSDIFGVEREKDGLKSIISNVYQSFSGEDVHPTVEEKIANLFYITTKNHVFVDGNKRIAATLFIYALDFYNLLYRNDTRIIDNTSLSALTLLIAESNPKEKPVMVDLIKNFIN